MKRLLLVDDNMEFLELFWLFIHFLIAAIVLNWDKLRWLSKGVCI